MSAQESVSVLFPDQDVVPPTKVRIGSESASIDAGGPLASGETLYMYERNCGRSSLTPVPLLTAEQHISESGFGSVRLVSLLDLESKLVAAGTTSPKLSETRQWLDAILMQFALNPSPQSHWPEPPYSFESIVQEAIGALSQTTL